MINNIQNCVLYLIVSLVISLTNVPSEYLSVKGVQKKLHCKNFSPQIFSNSMFVTFLMSGDGGFDIIACPYFLHSSVALTLLFKKGYLKFNILDCTQRVSSSISSVTTPFQSSSTFQLIFTMLTIFEEGAYYTTWRTSAIALEKVFF